MEWNNTLIMRGKIKFVTVITFIIILILLNLYGLASKGFFVQKSSFDKTFNENRNKMKIPIIEPKWKDIDNRDLYWQDTNFIHESKILIIESNFINREVDKFILSRDSILFHFAEYSRLNKNIENCYFEIQINQIKIPITYNKALKILNRKKINF